MLTFLLLKFCPNLNCFSYHLFMILGIIPDSTFLTWLAVGIVAGIIMHLIDKREVKGGIVATVITGLLGALIGGFLSSAVFGIGVTGLNITSIVIAVAGG